MFNFLELMKKNSDAVAENKRWVDLSVKFESYEEYFLLTIQGLGRFSMYLDEIDNNIQEEFLNGKDGSAEFSSKLQDAITLSHLWVLGAYEALRTLCEKAEFAEKDGKISNNIFCEIQKKKHLFEKIRIPLAKMKSWRDKTEYFPIAYPGMDVLGGIGWRIGKNEFVSRKALSDSFLALEKIDFSVGSEVK